MGRTETSRVPSPDGAGRRRPPRVPPSAASVQAPPALKNVGRATPTQMLALQRTAGNQAVRQLVTAPPGPAPTPTLEAPTATSGAAGPVPVQALAEPGGGGGGLLERVMSGVRSGWQRLRSSADGAITSVRERASGVVQAVTARGEGLVSRLQGGWTSLRDTVTGAAQGFGTSARQAFGGVFGGVARLAAAVASGEPDAIEAAWGAITGAAGGAWQRVQALGSQVTQRLSGLWNSLTSGFGSGLNLAEGAAQRAAGGLRDLAGAALGRLSGAWQGLGRLVQSASGAAGGVVGWVAGAVGRLFPSLANLWSGLGRQWADVRRTVGDLGGRVAAEAGAVWTRAKALAQSTLQGVSSAWGVASAGVSGLVRRVGGGARSLWQKISGFSIGGLVGKLRRYLGPVRGIRELVANPRAAIEPYATPIAASLSGGMPGAAETAARQHMPQPGEAGHAAGTPPPPGPVIQRRAAPETETQPVERSTSGAGEIWAGLRAAWSEKWAHIDVKQMVLDTLLSIVWPWPKIGEELKGIGSDFKKAASSLFTPTGGGILAILHDLWSNIMHLADFPLVLWRRLNNIGLLLMGPITIVLTIIGAIGGSLAGTVLGAVAGALGGLGVGAAPGAGGGLAVGGAAGAGAGFGLAMAVGEVLVISFAAGEATAFIKALVDLTTVRQTRQEKLDDYSTAADSSLALGITALLVAIGWIGGRIASFIAAALRRFTPASVLAVIDEFAQGARRVRGKGEPVADDDSSVGAMERVPGKLRLELKLRNVREGVETLRGRLDTLGPEARPDLRARLQALDQRMAELQQRAKLVETPEDVARIQAEMREALKPESNLTTDVSLALNENGPYSHIPDPPDVGPRRPFRNRGQRDAIFEANRRRGGDGRLRSDDPLDPHQVLSNPARAVGGTDLPRDMATIDHIVAESNGGSNSSRNARVVSSEWNGIKRNR